MPQAAVVAVARVGRVRAAADDRGRCRL